MRPARGVDPGAPLDVGGDLVEELLRVDFSIEDLRAGTPRFVSIASEASPVGPLGIQPTRASLSVGNPRQRALGEASAGGCSDPGEGLRPPDSLQALYRRDRWRS